VIRARTAGILGLVLLTAATLMRPSFPEDQALQQIGTCAGLAFLVVAWKRWQVSGGAFAAFLAFLVLHVIGARWVYSYVPYDDWCETLLGFRPGRSFGWQRNHYDRFVHLAYGLLSTAIFAQVLERAAQVRHGLAVFLAVMMITATSALYEIGEWLVAMLVAPERAERYLGQQGDPWDAHKDMACAVVGSCAAALVLALRRPRSALP
jgi:putative membrane protein